MAHAKRKSGLAERSSSRKRRISKGLIFAPPVSHESFPKYDRRAMTNVLHPRFPDRYTDGRFAFGHAKIGGRKSGGETVTGRSRKCSGCLRESSEGAPARSLNRRFAA
jgi:hypothetical protein